jgi:hypothetical protein
MSNIALRLSESKLTNLSFDENVAIGEQYLFDTVSCLPKLIVTTEIQGTLNNGRKYSNLLFSNYEQEIIISSNELTDSVINFLINFWVSPFKYISRKGSLNWSSYTQVNTIGGAFPIEYIDGLIQLPEITIKFSETNPVSL